MHHATEAGQESSAARHGAAQLDEAAMSEAQAVSGMNCHLSYIQVEKDR